MSDTGETARWIIATNWERFQHYKDRTPLWVKNYTELMSDDAYLGLTLHQRGVLHGLWLEYARARRQIPDSTLTVSRRLGERVTRATLDALNQAGFISFSASKPLAESYQPASPEKEKEVEEKPPYPPIPKQRKTRRKPNGAEAWVRNVGWTLLPDARNELEHELRDRQGCDEPTTEHLVHLAEELAGLTA